MLDAFAILHRFLALDGHAGAPTIHATPHATFARLGPVTGDTYDGDGNPNALYGGGSDDTMHGFGGDDFIQGNDGKDTMYGGDGNDNMGGGNDKDFMYGGAGNDSLSALGNVVALTTTGPSDVIDGGGGIDHLFINYQSFVIIGDGHAATIHVNISTGSGEVNVSGFRGENFTSIEQVNVVCPDGDDVVTGGKYNDRIDAYAGDDIVKAGAGNDTVSDTSGFVDADGGKGDDTIELFRDADTGKVVIDANAGTISVGGHDRGTFTSFEYNAILYGGTNNDTLTGLTNSFNTLGGNDGNDTLAGGSAIDVLYGGADNDKIYGGGDNDNITGGSGTNTMYGGDGNDIIYSGSGATDTVDAGTGDDAVTADATPLRGSFDGGTGNDILKFNFSQPAGTYDLHAVPIVGFESLVALGYAEDADYTLKFTTQQFARFDNIDLSADGNHGVIAFTNGADVVLKANTAFEELDLANGGQKVDLSDVTSAGLPAIVGGTGKDTVIGPDANVVFHAALGNGNDAFTGGNAQDQVAGGNGEDTLDGGNRNDTLNGNDGHDTLDGGDGADTLNGGADADAIVGGTGNDVFAYDGVGDSTGADFDTIDGADFAAADRFNLPFAVGGIDAEVTHGSLSGAHFDNDLKNAIGSHQLKVGHAVLFTPSGGQFKDANFLIVDANGEAGYQPGEDLVVRLDNAAHLSALGSTDFI